MCYNVDIMQSVYFEGPITDGRRANPGEKKGWQATQMWEKYHEIVRLRTTGMNEMEIAKKVNLGNVHVCNILGSPIVQEKLMVMRGARDADSIDVAQRIKDLAPVALDLLEVVIKGEGKAADAPILGRARVAGDLLSRAGHPPIQKVQGAFAHLSGDDIRELKERAKVNGKACGTIIDVEEVKDVKDT